MHECANVHVQEEGNITHHPADDAGFIVSSACPATSPKKSPMHASSKAAQ